MSTTLRSLGFGLILAWLVLLAATQVGLDRFSWDHYLRDAGLVLAGIGSVAQAFTRQRSRGKLRDGCCVRCGRRTRAGQIYCDAHFKETLRSNRRPQRPFS